MPRITAPELLRMKARGEKIAMITAYDAVMARLVDGAGVEMVLVGDSLGNVVQGRPDTLRVTVDEVCYHGRCVASAIERAHLTLDMPFGSYQLSPEQGLATAIRFVQDGRAQSVKLEGGERSAAAIARIVEAGIPVVGHVGLTPQSVHAFGGFKVQGRDEAEAARVLADAVAVEQAGAFAIVLEMVPAPLAQAITERLSIPTIGIGAGAACDGQVLVCTDLLGMDPRFKPRFVKHYAEVGAIVDAAVKAYVAEVKAGAFPEPSHAFGAGRTKPTEAP